ncbi:MULTISPECIES: DUF2326 domain-containing protein [unclassified Pseudoalteromonas]|uniref:DUF2326 domain-containing protein n=1 Tax=unclassified Pseudoalteromonas TaxID=194690 RepID=UPI0005A5D270|nr:MULTISPECIES: DUF2326 domain-containing protein [unclassified Pseudoalteromonas]
MQLEVLNVYKDGKVLRTLTFNKGLNIVTNTEENGNQIGKSTALRVINFCLGSDGKSIWKDPDSKVVNDKVKQLVTSGRVEFELILSTSGKAYVIKRKISELQQKSKVITKIYSTINGEEYSSQEKFKEALAPALGLCLKNPSYSSIKNRFVRLDKNTASSIYRYLHSSTSDQKYTLYYSYLFGFSGHDDLAKAIELDEQKGKKQARISILLKGMPEKYYKDKLKSIDDEIEFLKLKEEEFDFKDVQNKGVIKLKSLREEISLLTSFITKINARISYSIQTIEGYENSKVNIDTALIEKIYNDALKLVPNLQKELDDVVIFHQQVINKKVQYLQEKIEGYEQDVERNTVFLNRKLDKEKELFKSLIGESHLSGFFVIESEIQEKREERGRVSVIIDEVAIESNEINDLEGQIQTLRARNKQKIVSLKAKTDIFNEHFKVISRQVFKDFSLSLNVSTKSDSSELEFSIVNMDKVSGDGSPRAASLSFDMAFVEFVKQEKIKFPHFTIQDYLEAADQDKLATLAKLSSEKKIQVVVSILKDKLASLSPEFITENTILSLKKSDKFFKV